MKAFITGITGFAGSFLAENLLARGSYDVSGTYLTDSSLDNVKHLEGKVKLHKIDLQDANLVNKIIGQEKPDQIFHLAAITAPGDSFKNPDKYLSNITVQLNLLEAVRGANINPRILIVSSGEIYGAINPEDLPIDEDTPFRPANPYAVTKIAQDFLGLQYFIAYKLQIIRVRPFNHIGPRQSTDFVVSSFAKKIADIEKGKTDPILTVGNLSAKRDFTDVHDTIEAYVRIIEKGTAGDVYNIGSGHSIQIKEIVEKLISLSKTKIDYKVDDALIRPTDTPDLICDNTKIKLLTGWEPKISIDQTLRETLEYWREQN